MKKLLFAVLIIFYTLPALAQAEEGYDAERIMAEINERYNSWTEEVKNCSVPKEWAEYTLSPKSTSKTFEELIIDYEALIKNKNISDDSLAEDMIRNMEWLLTKETNAMHIAKLKESLYYLYWAIGDTKKDRDKIDYFKAGLSHRKGIELFFYVAYYAQASNGEIDEQTKDSYCKALAFAKNNPGVIEDNLLLLSTILGIIENY